MLAGVALMQKLQLGTPVAGAAGDAGHLHTHCHWLLETTLVLPRGWQTCDGLCFAAHYQQEQPLGLLEHLLSATMAYYGGGGLHLCCGELCLC